MFKASLFSSGVSFCRSKIFRIISLLIVLDFMASLHATTTDSNYSSGIYDKI